MAEGYQGEFPVDIATTEYHAFTPADWAMLWIEMYGQIDGAHHKAWTLDQVARILKGTPVIIKEARWTGLPSELRFTLDEPTPAYAEWVDEQMGVVAEGEHEYDYEVGVAP
ncbi:MAG: hypothetical protein EOO77_21300 [Oxalobacteraceae bacterium]|nr:MAG: hypothetical protein EOO77_21300 [Oxalobacteraceae bacterium]